MCLGVPGKVVSISGEDLLSRSGVVDFGGVSKTVSLSLLEDVQIGDYVIVHAGFALNSIDEDEAKKVFEYLTQMGELAELEPNN